MRRALESILCFAARDETRFFIFSLCARWRDVYHKLDSFVPPRRAAIIIFLLMYDIEWRENNVFGRAGFRRP